MVISMVFINILFYINILLQLSVHINEYKNTVNLIKY